jgi:hypothetical protein
VQVPFLVIIGASRAVALHLQLVFWAVHCIAVGALDVQRYCQCGDALEGAALDRILCSAVLRV